ncbi:hypothetical protein [Xanthomonas arboricola]|uniref:hypothetical protein n=1 Tax=Xanthomonas arboricola TaxID=56448 RepID=UPI000CEEBD2E|nr:hypothetical protein [Xanthomonas arboricola]PPT46446.1 hypothetical protein XarjCFBP7652_17600 [Xanthomonas arboricola]
MNTKQHKDGLGTEAANAVRVALPRVGETLARQLATSQSQRLRDLIRPQHRMTEMFNTLNQASTLGRSVERLRLPSAIQAMQAGLLGQHAARLQQMAGQTASHKHFGRFSSEIALQSLNKSLFGRHAELLQQLADRSARFSQLSPAATALREPSLSVQETLRQLFAVPDLAPVVVGLDAIELATAASAEVHIGDEVTPPAYGLVAPADLGWWAKLPQAERLAIIFFLITCLMQLPGFIKDSRELFGEDNAPSKAQLEDLLELSRAQHHTLERIAVLEQLTAEQSAESTRNQALIAQSLKLIARQMAGLPCEVRQATPLRTLTPDGKILARMAPEQRVLCLDHQGKWLEVIYEGPNGEEIRGWALKKHLRWEGVR